MTFSRFRREDREVSIKNLVLTIIFWSLSLAVILLIFILSSIPVSETDNLTDFLTATFVDSHGFNIYANDRAGLLNDVTRNFSERDINILKVNTMTSKHGIATLTISFEVKSVEDLQEICGKLQNIRGVQAVKRTNG